MHALGPPGANQRVDQWCKGNLPAGARDASERDEILRVLKGLLAGKSATGGAAARLGLKRTTLISHEQIGDQFQTTVVTSTLSTLPLGKFAHNH
jgi:hypothetical protein